MTGFNDRASLAAQHSRNRFHAMGWPGRELECFHYTDLKTKLGARFDRLTQFVQPEISGDRAAGEAGSMDWGLWAADLENEHGSLAHLVLSEGGDEKTWVITSSNFSELRINIRVKDGRTAAWRHRYVVGPSAEVTIIEVIEGSMASLGFGWSHIELAEGAKAQFVRLIKGQGGSLNLLSVNQMAKSTFLAVGLLSGPQLVRESWVLNHQGAEAESRIRAVVLANEDQHVDLHSSIRHLAGKGSSQQTFRSVLNDRGRGVFQGKILIARDAQEVQSAQIAQNLLLSTEAEANTKPELEIYADNVKANHGATVGRLDDEQIYYLMSRGLSKSAASQLIAEGFVKDSLKELRPGPHREDVEDWMRERLNLIVRSESKT